MPLQRTLYQQLRGFLCINNHLSLTVNSCFAKFKQDSYAEVLGLDNTNKINTLQVEELERVLRKVSSIIKRRGRDILTDFKITPPQFSALLVLRKNGEMTIGELGEQMYLACSTATDLVDRMERNELVTRARDTKDRRVIRIKVLEKGNQVFKEVMSSRINYLNGVLQKVNIDDCTEMIKYMSMLLTLMKEDSHTN